ncbi:heat shock protein beta-7 isoform X3 [Hemicordylus capensis]|uniref:heat shock protein beta-7 isoform X3 n=1 Tax=Hemicordylus capensis TaxID=884348 RepID=UPI0023024DA3|nr:heat shock protein beta-7 isoform X3 [Hemicordylus capensis]
MRQQVPEEASLEGSPALYKLCLGRGGPAVPKRWLWAASRRGPAGATPHLPPEEARLASPPLPPDRGRRSPSSQRRPPSQPTHNPPPSAPRLTAAPSSSSRLQPSRAQPMEKAHGIFGEDFGGFMRPRSEPLAFTGRAGNMGNIKTLGDTYQFAVDVRDFSPEDIIITTSKNQIEVRAEKEARAVYYRRKFLLTRTL